jgi:hypothetical protein
LDSILGLETSIKKYEPKNSISLGPTEELDPSLSYSHHSMDGEYLEGASEELSDHNET